MISFLELRLEFRHSFLSGELTGVFVPNAILVYLFEEREHFVLGIDGFQIFDGSELVPKIQRRVLEVS